MRNPDVAIANAALSVHNAWHSENRSQLHRKDVATTARMLGWASSRARMDWAGWLGKDQANAYRAQGKRPYVEGRLVSRSSRADLWASSTWTGATGPT